MPSGPKKRRAAKKKKKKAKASKKSTPRPSHGESGGGKLSSSQDQHNSPRPVVKAEEREDNSSGNQSLTIERTEKAAKETQSEIEIDRESSSQKPHEKCSNSRSSSPNHKSCIDKKKAAIIEPASVADLIQPIKLLPEKGTCKVEDLADLAAESSPVIDPSKPVGCLVELASQVYDNTKLQEKNDVVVAEMPLEQNNSPTSTGEVVGSVPKEDGVEKLVSLDDKASPKLKDHLPASTDGICPFCGRNITDRVNEPETPECSEKQPLLGSAPRAAEKTSWKSCCGIFELFSGSSR